MGFLGTITKDVIPVVAVAAPSFTETEEYREILDLVREAKANPDASYSFVRPVNPNDATTALLDEKENKEIGKLLRMVRVAGAAEDVTMRKELSKVLSKNGKIVEGIKVKVWATKRIVRPRGGKPAEKPAE